MIVKAIYVYRGCSGYPYFVYPFQCEPGAVCWHTHQLVPSHVVTRGASRLGANKNSDATRPTNIPFKTMQIHRAQFIQ